MKTEVESISPVKKKLSVEIPAERVAQEEEAALRDLRRSVTLPGFRKGKAPLSLIRRHYGDRVRADVLGRLIEESYREAVLSENLVPVSDADIQIQSMPEEGALAYTAVIEVRPEVEARTYTGLTLKKERVEVDEAEVDEQLERLRQSRATFEPAPEGHEAAEGDMVVMDFTGTVDGEPLEGGSGEDRSVILGTGTLVEGFEEQLKGAKAGEERTVEITFPDDYPNEAIAGKTAQFQVTVKEVKVRTVPELDDEFAKDVAEVEGLEELRDTIRDQIRAEKEKAAENRFRDRLIDALLDANPFEVPPSQVQEQLEFSMARIKEDLARRGLDLAQIGIDEGQFRENQRAAAERTVRWAYLVGAIARAEGIEITDADVDARIEEIAQADGRPVSLVKSFFEQGGRLEGLRNYLLEQRVIERVVEGCTVEEVDPEELEGQGEAGDE
ncbi:trigger factor [Deferrisoma palaeochoriense]